MNDTEFNNELTHCMKQFPELGRPRLLVEWSSDDLAGASGYDKDGPVIVLIIPERFRDLPASVVRPLIYHELAHRIDLEHPDKVFYERADIASIALWRGMQAEGLLGCSHPKDNTIELGTYTLQARRLE